MRPYVVLALWLLWICPALSRAQTCPALEAKAREKLTSFVQKKYSLPAQLEILVVEEGFIENSCYRKVRFVSRASAQFFDLTATLAPDQVFLVDGLTDSRIDPVLVLRKQEADRNAELTRGSPPSRGDASAPISIVVFSDFECPYCKAAARVFKEVPGPDSHDARLLFRQYPLDFHPWAAQAALLTSCAADQGSEAFWNLHDLLFDQQSGFNPESLGQQVRSFLARLPGFKLAPFDKCLLDQTKQAAIQADVALGNSLGVEGTPAIFVNGRKYSGPLTPEGLRRLISQVGPDWHPATQSQTQAGK